MAKTKKEKKEIIEQYKDLLKGSKGFVVVQPEGITVNEQNEFKKNLHDYTSSFHVVKNTLFRIALKETENPELENIESGKHAVLFLEEDIVNPAKQLKEFIENTKIDKKNYKVQVVTGVLEGNVLTVDQVVELAEMPTFEGSISMILGILDQAIGGVANVLEDSVKSYVSIIDQAFEENK